MYQGSNNRFAVLVGGEIVRFSLFFLAATPRDEFREAAAEVIAIVASDTATMCDAEDADFVAGEAVGYLGGVVDRARGRSEGRE